MLPNPIRLSSRGRVTLPVQARRFLRARKGTRLLVTEEFGRIVIRNANKTRQEELDERRDWDAIALHSLRDTWDNEADEIWNDA